MTKPKSKTHGIVMVEWVDSSSDSGWRKKEDALQDDCHAKCCTAGIVLKEDKDAVTITHSYSLTTGQINATISIPRCAITRIRRLKVI